MLYEVITGSVGREGPTVQMCASIGSSLARWFPMTTAQLRIMVHAASVAGLAAAFNTPIAGVRITSYNVCYTKLLRSAAVGIAFLGYRRAMAALCSTCRNGVRAREF